MIQEIPEDRFFNLNQFLSKLKESTAAISPSEFYPVDGDASIMVKFENGTNVHAVYWRLIKNEKNWRSSFDHTQKYGLRSQIDAIKDLHEELTAKKLIEAYLDLETGDLKFFFKENLQLTIFNFSSYEIWQIHHPDHLGWYSPQYR